MRAGFHRADRGSDGLVIAADQRQIADELDALMIKLDAARPYDIGFPGSSDLHHAPLADLMTRYLINNIGDPYEDNLGLNETKSFERAVLDLFAELFRAPAGGWWGCVTNGSTEGTLHGLRTARSALPEGVVLRSTSAHVSVDKAADLLAMPSDVVASDRRGEMDYRSLATKLAQHRHRRPVIVATAGTTMTEAVDDVHRIVAVCDELGIRERYIHVDAALSGLPLAVAPPRLRAGFDLADGADSVVTSGHKFLSTLMPCAVLLVKRDRMRSAGQLVNYIGGHDTTIASSRSGHLPLLLWSALRRHGVDGLRLRAQRARRVAEYALAQLTAAGWEAWRHDHAFTVVLRTPPASVTARWPLPPSGDGWSHLIATPSVTRTQVDEFVADLVTATKATKPAPSRPTVVVGF